MFFDLLHLVAVEVVIHVAAFLTLFKERIDDFNETVSEFFKHGSEVNLVAGDFADEVVESADEGVEFVD